MDTAVDDDDAVVVVVEIEADGEAKLLLKLD